MTMHSPAAERHTSPAVADWHDTGEDGYLARGNAQLREIVRDHEGQTVLIALAAGVCVGALVGAALGSSRARLSWHDRKTAEGIGRRFLENVGRFVPDAISDRLGS